VVRTETDPGLQQPLRCLVPARLRPIRIFRRHLLGDTWAADDDSVAGRQSYDLQLNAASHLRLVCLGGPLSRPGLGGDRLPSWL